jgi:flagella basal body P-ring formation protein FlgA
MVALQLALLVASSAVPTAPEVLPGEVSESLQRALVVPAGRIVPLRWTLSGQCRVASASVPRPIDGSGRVAVKVSGRGCSGWGWAEVQVWAETSVTTRVVRAGERLGSGVTVAEREIRPGHLPFIAPDDAIASHTLPLGAAIGPTDVSRTSVTVGDPIKIVFVSGSVAIETQGRRTTCFRARDCAVLASGKHVEGHIDDNGRLIVEVPR